MQQLSHGELADWCRALSTSIKAGLGTVKAFRYGAEKGTGRVRAASASVVKLLDEGEDLAGALNGSKDYFPQLFTTLMNVAVKTSKVPEVLQKLERYYRLQVDLKRKFIQQITWPVLQLFAAIFIIALVIYILGIVGNGHTDTLGLGLIGASGAMIWLTGWACIFGAMFAAYKFTRSAANGKALVDKIILAIPALGPCIRTFAISRLSFAMSLTLDSGMSTAKAIDLSLDTAENGAILETKGAIISDIKKGESLDDAFSKHTVYPRDFLEVLQVGVTSGEVPESMARLSEVYNEQAEYQLRILNQILGWVVWTVVAVTIIFLIFKMFFTAYLGPLNDALGGK